MCTTFELRDLSGCSAAAVMMIQMSPLFYGDQRMVLETSEQINKANKEYWDKLGETHARIIRNMASAFSIATKVTLEVDDYVLQPAFMLS